jgi:hypothetical protein
VSVQAFSAHQIVFKFIRKVINCAFLVLTPYFVPSLTQSDTKFHEIIRMIIQIIIVYKISFDITKSQISFVKQSGSSLFEI